MARQSVVWDFQVREFARFIWRGFYLHGPGEVGQHIQGSQKCLHSKHGETFMDGM